VSNEITRNRHALDAQFAGDLAAIDRVPVDAAPSFRKMTDGTTMPAFMEVFSRNNSAHCPRIAAVSTVSQISDASDDQGGSLLDHREFCCVTIPDADCKSHNAADQ
jgi:hypothetical protein